MHLDFHLPLDLFGPGANGRRLVHAAQPGHTTGFTIHCSPIDVSRPRSNLTHPGGRAEGSAVAPGAVPSPVACGCGVADGPALGDTGIALTVGAGEMSAGRVVGKAVGASLG